MENDTRRAGWNKEDITLEEELAALRARDKSKDKREEEKDESHDSGE